MKAIDLFSGVGGLSLGFMKAGFKIVAAFDNWEKAIEIYKSNFDHPVINVDLSDVKASIELLSEFDFDIIIGGPPCQDFSHAGKRQEGAKADLTLTFSQIVSFFAPRFFIMENVDRAKNSKNWQAAKCILKDRGYGITEIVLDASLCGVPQKRKRFFALGVLNGIDNDFVDIIHSNIASKALTVKEYLADELELDYYYRHPRNYNRRGIFSTNEPSPTVRGVNRPLPDGYKGHPGDPVKVSKIIRPLTTYERSRIQTFPKHFIWKGSKTNLEQMIGNAVPVNLGYFVATMLSKYIKANDIKLVKVC